MGYWKWIYTGIKEIFSLKDILIMISMFFWFIFMSLLGAYLNVLFNLWLFLFWCVFTIGVFFLVFLYLIYKAEKEQNLSKG